MRNQEHLRKYLFLLRLNFLNLLYRYRYRFKVYFSSFLKEKKSDKFRSWVSKLLRPKQEVKLFRICNIGPYKKLYWYHFVFFFCWFDHCNPTCAPLSGCLPAWSPSTSPRLLSTCRAWRRSPPWLVTVSTMRPHSRRPRLVSPWAQVSKYIHPHFYGFESRHSAKNGTGTACTV